MFFYNLSVEVRSGPIAIMIEIYIDYFVCKGYKILSYYQVSFIRFLPLFNCLSGKVHS